MQFTFKIPAPSLQQRVQQDNVLDEYDEHSIDKNIIQTLLTEKVKLDYNSKLIDFDNDVHDKVLVLKDQYDRDLLSQSSYAITGTLIHCKGVVMLISFGGLMGEFKIDEEITYHELQNSHELPEEWYVYIIQNK